MIKLSHGVVCFQWYPDFDTDPHPTLRYSIPVRIAGEQRRLCKPFDRRNSQNPPVLHRKDLLVHPTYPHYAAFKSLADQELAAGLLSRTNIGTVRAWRNTLRRTGWQVSGYNLIRTCSTPLAMLLKD